MKKTLIGITFLISIFSLLSSSVFANNFQYPIIVGTKSVDNVVVFELCMAPNECEYIGDENGYDSIHLDYKAFDDKLYAFVVGGVQGTMAVLAVLGAVVSTPITGGVIVLGVGANIAMLQARLKDEANPLYLWRRSEVKLLTNKDNFEDKETIIIESNNDLDVLDFFLMLKQVLDQSRENRGI